MKNKKLILGLAIVEAVAIWILVLLLTSGCSTIKDWTGGGQKVRVMMGLQPMEARHD